MFIALSLGIFVAAGIEFALGKGAWVAQASTATQGIVVILAVVGQASHNLIARACACDATDIRLTLRRARLHRALSRLSDAFLWILGAAWLGETWGLDLVDPAPGTIERLFVRPALEAAATVVAAWILWTVLSAVIDEKMPPPAAPGDEDEIPGSASRLDTLLPLVRNTLLIGLAVIAVIVALATLGLDIGPLLAGLGVLGIAVGFGAQSLVRDVISGIFFLMEDAFRVGEYIDTGRLRGTVEGMSLRSVRLRHQNGQVHTIPFGQVLSVTNYSRDWSVVKFNLHLEPTADIETVRKTGQAGRRGIARRPRDRRRFHPAAQDAGCRRRAADGPRRALQIHRDAGAPDLSAAPGVASSDRRLRRRRNPLCRAQHHGAARQRRRRLIRQAPAPPPGATRRRPQPDRIGSITEVKRVTGEDLCHPLPPQAARTAA